MNSKSITRIILIFILSRLFFSIIFAASEHYLIDMRNYYGGAFYSDVPVLGDYAYYDSIHYINIANHGYNNADAYVRLENNNVIPDMEAAFYPLLPFLMKILTVFTGLNVEICGYVISNLSFCVFLLFFKKILLHLRYESDIPLVFISFFPSAMIFSSIYTESLFLLLTSTTVYYAFKRKWGVCFILGILAGLCRNTGVILCIFLFIEYLSSIDFKLSKVKWTALSIIGPGIGLLLVAGINLYYYRDPFLFIKVVSRFGRGFIDPFSFIYWFIRDTFDNFNTATLPYFLGIIPVLCGIVSAFTNKTLPVSLKALTLGVCMLTFTSTLNMGQIHSIGYIRYILPAFSIFVIDKKWFIRLFPIYFVCTICFAIYFNLGLFVM